MWTSTCAHNVEQRACERACRRALGERLARAPAERKRAEQRSTRARKPSYCTRSWRAQPPYVRVRWGGRLAHQQHTLRGRRTDEPARARARTGAPGYALSGTLPTVLLCVPATPVPQLMRFSRQPSHFCDAAHGWQRTSNKPFATTKPCETLAPRTSRVSFAPEQQPGGELRMRRARGQHAGQPWRYTLVHIDIHMHILFFVSTCATARMSAGCVVAHPHRARARSRARFCLLRAREPRNPSMLARLGRKARTDGFTLEMRTTPARRTHPPARPQPTACAWTAHHRRRHGTARRTSAPPRHHNCHALDWIASLGWQLPS
jgi:hypothetical protein